ncbi:MgtC/SapB family protein [Synechocystis salina LEGE 06155]|nr:MgtC/SapB family protein [Synechocystis salina LEGE 06155]
MELSETLLRLVMAFVLGSGLGIERQWRQRMAGLRTNTLVATGAAMFVIVSVLTTNDSSPTRIPAQIVSGIGFLAGGVILKEGLTVKGLNTAATLWCSAAVGTLCGRGLFSEAFIGAIMILIANIALRPLSRLINEQPLDATELEYNYLCSLVCRGDDEVNVRGVLLDSLEKIEGAKLQSLKSHDLDEFNHFVEVEAEVICPDRKDHFLEGVVSQLSLQPSVKSASWRISEQESD